MFGSLSEQTATVLVPGSKEQILVVAVYNKISLKKLLCFWEMIHCQCSN